MQRVACVYQLHYPESVYRCVLISDLVPLVGGL